MVNELGDLRGGLNGGWTGYVQKLKRVKTAMARNKILWGLDTTKQIEVSMDQIEKLLLGGDNGKKGKR
jgi:hypothetical protein